MPRTMCSARLVTLATIVVAGLTTAVAPAGAAPKDDACALLTKQDAVAALGEEVSTPKSTSGLPMGPGTTAASCEYTGSGYHGIQLTLIRMSPDMAAMTRAMCAQKGKDGLTGLGELACWYNDDHEELQVVKGTTFFSIQLRGRKNPTEPIKAAAKSVLARLK